MWLSRRGREYVLIYVSQNGHVADSGGWRSAGMSDYVSVGQADISPSIMLAARIYLVLWVALTVMDVSQFYLGLQ